MAVEGRRHNNEAYTSEEKERTFPSPGRKGQAVGMQEEGDGGWLEVRDSGRRDERNFSRARNGSMGAGPLAEGYTRPLGRDGREGEPHCPSVSGCAAPSEGEGVSEDDTRAVGASGQLGTGCTLSHVDGERNAASQRENRSPGEPTGVDEDDLSIRKETECFPIDRVESKRLYSEVTAGSPDPSGKTGNCVAASGDTDAKKKASQVERGGGGVSSGETEGQRAAGKEKSDAAGNGAEASRPVTDAGQGEQSAGGLPLYLRHVLLYRKHVATSGAASRKKAAV